MTNKTPLAGSPGPGSKGAEMTKTEDTTTPVRRGRGRPPLPSYLKAKPKPRPGRDAYKEVRLKQEIAGIKPKQFFILEADFYKAEALMSVLIFRAKEAYDRVSKEIEDATGGEPVSPPKPKTPAPPETVPEPEPEPVAAEKVRKPIKERGKLRLKL